MKYLTVFSDASYHYESKAGGYAFFVRDNLTIIKRSFPLKWETARSQDVEMFAMCHAIFYAVNKLPHEPGDEVVAQTDCLDVIRLFDERRDPAAASIWGILEAAGVSLRFKHVKAHTGADDKRSYVNRWCDIQARREQRRARGWTQTRFVN